MVSCQKTGQVNVLPYYNSPDFTPLWLTDAKTIDTLHTVSAFGATDQDGNTISGKTFKGKIYVANFFLPVARAFA